MTKRLVVNHQSPITRTMSEARVDNIDAIRAFRAALLKFRDAANVAIADAESEAIGTMRWLEVDQRT